MKRAKKIKNIDEHYRAVAESTDDSICLIDLDFKYLLANKKHLSRIGVSLENVVGKDYAKFHAKSSIPAVKEKFAEVLETKESLAYEYQSKRDDIFFLRTVSPVFDDECEIESIAIISKDITAQKQAELELRSLTDIQNQFIKIISHQLRTPLNSMVWNLESLITDKDSGLKDEHIKILKLTYEASRNVIQRLGDLLTAMDIEEGKITLSIEKASIVSIFGAALVPFKTSFELKEIDFDFERPKKSLLPVDIDREKMNAVFTQMLSNAVLYTPEKGKITAKFTATKNKIKFALTDSGVGIPEAEQASIAKKFFRASNAFTMATDQSGVGLFIAKTYIEMHGGRMGFKSIEGKGSTFWFELPVKPRVGHSIKQGKSNSVQNKEDEKAKNK